MAASNEYARELAVRASGALETRDDPVLQTLVEQARHLLATDAAAISIVYRDWQYFIAAAGTATGVYGRRASICGHAILHPESVFVVPDTFADARFAENPAVAGAVALRFYAGAPLITGPGLPIGTLCAYARRPRARLDAFETHTLARLAQVAVRRFDELRICRREARPPA